MLQFLEQSKDYELKLASADEYYQNRQLKSVFKTWKLRANEFKEINFHVECKYQQKKREKSLEILNRLKQNAMDNKRERHCENLAETFYLKHLMLKIITEWKIYSSQRVLKRQTEAEQIAKFMTIKNSMVLSSYYGKWKERVEALIADDVKHRAAVEFNERKNKEKSLRIWQTFVRSCAKKTLLNQQAKYFLEARLKTEFYYKWCNAYAKELSMRDKNQEALIFWSVSIQRKCLQAWMKWVLQKRDKKDRYKAALDRRQHDILKVCGRNFIQYSTDSKLRRLEANKLLKENNLLEKIQLQSKYFNIWLEKCSFFKNKKRTLLIQLPASHQQQQQQIVESSTLEHKEMITGVLSDLCPKPRPAPRKPSFLIDSIDINTNPTTTRVQSPFNTNIEFTEIINPIRSVDLNEPIEVVNPPAPAKKSPTVLMPPSAFTSVTIVTGDESQKSAINVVETSPISPRLNKLPLASGSTVLMASNCTNISLKKKANERRRQEQVQKDLELIEFKKMLENLAIKSENLK